MTKKKDKVLFCDICGFGVLTCRKGQEIREHTWDCTTKSDSELIRSLIDKVRSIESILDIHTQDKAHRELEDMLDCLHSL